MKTEYKIIYDDKDQSIIVGVPDHVSYVSAYGIVCLAKELMTSKLMDDADKRRKRSIE